MTLGVGHNSVQDKTLQSTAPIYLAMLISHAPSTAHLDLIPHVSQTLAIPSSKSFFTLLRTSQSALSIFSTSATLFLSQFRSFLSFKVFPDTPGELIPTAFSHTAESWVTRHNLSP